MANGGNSENGDGIPEGSSAFLKQIISKLKDPAALYSLALFVLAFPLGKAMDDFPLAYWMALAFSVPVLLLRAYQIYVKGRNDAHKLELDNRAKLATITSNHQLKLARLHAKTQVTATASIPGVSVGGASVSLGSPQGVPRLPSSASQQSKPRNPRSSRRSSDPVIKGS